MRLHPLLPLRKDYMPLGMLKTMYEYDRPDDVNLTRVTEFLLCQVFNFLNSSSSVIQLRLFEEGSLLGGPGGNASA